MNDVVSRREFLAQSGMLVVAWSSSRSLAKRGGVEELPLSHAVPPSASSLDSWLAISSDGSVTTYCGKVELGTGISTALRQIVAEELDVPFERITWVQGDSDRTVDQGSTVGSQSVKRGGAQLRHAAAEARAALLELASNKLGVPKESLTIEAGVVTVRGDNTRRATFSELIGGKRFERTVSGTAPTKRPSDYTVVGKPVPRVEMAAKMTGRHVYVHDVRVDGMLHARVVRPPRLGAKLLDVSDAPLAAIPGARLVRKEDFLAVVAPREDDAIRGARALAPKWSDAAPLPAMDSLYDTLTSGAFTDRIVADVGADASPATGSRLSATYRWPFQMHGSIGPSCGIADVRSDRATIWSSTQGSHALKGAIAQLTGLPADSVHVIWTEGSGCYGHNGSDDAAADAALISQIVRQPVRVQWSRADEHGWEPKGCAMVMRVSAGLGADGSIANWNYEVWTPTHSTRPGAGPGGAANFTAARLTGTTPTSHPSLGGDRNARHTYSIPQMKVVAHLLNDAPLRTSSFRGLGSPQNSFANESFMDELAYAAGVDPIEFRLRHLKDPRAIAAVSAAAKLAKWTPRQANSNANGKTGRGMAFVQYEGTEAYVAAIVDVEIDQSARAVRVARAYVAHDCGLIVNPDGLRNQIEGNVIQASSRTLKEQVTFDRAGVTSLDWRGYPILRFSEVPDSIEIALLDHPELPSVGAGEAATSPIPAAIANAVFDATGTRLRDVPLKLQLP